MSIRRLLVLLLLSGVVVGLAALPTMAQQQQELPRGTIEGGLSTLVASASVGGLSASVSTDGLYLAGAGRIHDRVEVFGAFNRYGLGGFGEVGSGRLFQFGAQYRLGPNRWIARPALRGGVMTSAEDGHYVSGGFSIRIGRRFGGVLSADYTSTEGILISVVHLGAYMGFGGGS